MADIFSALMSAAGASTSKPWDIASATFNGGQINWTSVQKQEESATDVFFKPDGTKMYVCGERSATSPGNSKIYEYDLSVAWDISTKSYLQSFEVEAQESTAQGLFFKPDGTEMYVTGVSSDYVNQYTLSTAWDISSASYTRQFSVNPQEANPRSVFFKSDGTKMYVTGSSGDDINEYNVSTAWNISTASYARVFSVAAQAGVPQVFFKPDGTKMYVLDGTSKAIYEYSLGTAWLVTSASYTSSYTLPTATTVGGSPTGVFFGPDGDTFFVIGNTNLVYKYAMATAWDITTSSYTAPEADFVYVNTNSQAPKGLFFKPDGTVMYLSDAATSVDQYTLSTAWDITTATYSRTVSTSGQNLTSANLFFQDDGSRMYVVGKFTFQEIYQYSIQAGQYWNVDYASIQATASVSAEDTQPNGLYIRPTGTRLYITGLAGDDVNQYSTTSAWSFGSMSYQKNFSVSSQDTTPNSLFFKDDGTKMYILGADTTSVYEYDLATAWEVDSATYYQSLSLDVFTPVPEAMFFNAEGTKLYIADSKINAVIGFDL